MAFLSSINFRIFFLLSLLFMISNADVSSPYDFVDEVCSKVDIVNLCMQVLKSDDRSKYANNITTLTQIALDVATKNVTNTRDYFQGVKTGPPDVMNSLADCIDAYSHMITGLANSMLEKDCSLIGYDIHVSGADKVDRCQAIVDSNGAHSSFITTSNKVTWDLCWLCESLANLMCDE